MVDDLVGGAAQQKAPGAGAALVAQHEQVEAALFGVVNDVLGRIARHFDWPGATAMERRGKGKASRDASLMRCDARQKEECRWLSMCCRAAAEKRGR